MAGQCAPAISFFNLQIITMKKRNKKKVERFDCLFPDGLINSVPPFYKAMFDNMLSAAKSQEEARIISGGTTVRLLAMALRFVEENNSTDIQMVKKIIPQIPYSALN